MIKIIYLLIFEKEYGEKPYGFRAPSDYIAKKKIILKIAELTESPYKSSIDDIIEKLLEITGTYRKTKRELVDEAFEILMQNMEDFKAYKYNNIGELEVFE